MNVIRKQSETRPAFVKESHLRYLDRLRESGVTNMWGAGTYLRRQFPKLDENTSSPIVGYWMETFGKETR